jgi:hypothetical protein
MGWHNILQKILIVPLLTQFATEQLGNLLTLKIVQIFQIQNLVEAVSELGDLLEDGVDQDGFGEQLDVLVQVAQGDGHVRAVVD